MMCLESLQIVVDLGRQLIKCVWAYALLNVRCGQLEAQTEEAGTAGCEHTSKAPATRGRIAPTGLDEARRFESYNARDLLFIGVRGLMPLGVGLGAHAR